MTAFTCLLATVLAVLSIPFLLIWRLTLTPQQKARYCVRQRGWSQRKTAQFLGISRHAVRCALSA
jgi:hypothetical protein